MFYTERKKENLRFLFFILLSFLINLCLIFFVPGFGKVDKKEIIDYENIRTGLISITDTNKVEYSKASSGVKSDKISVANEKMKNENKKDVQDVIESKEEKAKEVIPAKKTNQKFVGPKREDSGIEGIINTTSVSKTLKVKNNGTQNFKENNNTNEKASITKNDLKSIKTDNKVMKNGSKNIETGTLEKTSIGLDKESTTNNIQSNNKLNVNGKDSNTVTPKNISYNLLDVSGGRVVFNKYQTPEYPDEAEKNGWTGDVDVDFLIKDGKTIFLGVTGKSGYLSFDRSVEKAARNWRLSIEKNGNSVNGKVRVKVTFKF